MKVVLPLIANKRTTIAVVATFLAALAALFWLDVRTAETQTPPPPADQATYEVQDLGTLGDGINSAASGINDSGKVVGWSDNSSGRSHAFLYDGQLMKDLGTLEGGNYSEAFGINDTGKVVGESRTSSGRSRAFLYDGQMKDLNTLIPADSGWTILSAQAINNNGQIATYGYKEGVGNRALLLTPKGGAEEQIRDVQSSLDTIIENTGTDPTLAEELVDAKKSLEDAITALESNPPNRQAALQNIEQAMSVIQPAVDNGSLDATQGNRIMDDLAKIARQIALDAIEEAQDREGANQAFVAEAQAALEQGDVLRDSKEFTKAVDMYKDALAKAEAA